MQNKMDRYSQNWHSVSDKIENAVGSFRGSDTQIGEAFSDMKSTLDSIQNLDLIMSNLQTKTHTLESITETLHKGHSDSLEYLSQMSENSGGWGWWVYLLPLELLFVGLYIWYKKRKDGKLYKVL